MPDDWQERLCRWVQAFVTANLEWLRKYCCCCLLPRVPNDYNLPADTHQSEIYIESGFSDHQVLRIQQQPSSHNKTEHKACTEFALKVVLISDRYGTSGGDVSTINRQVALLTKENGATVYSTALFVTEKDRQEALQDEVELILPVDDSDDSDDEGHRILNLICLSKYSTVEYPHLPPDADFIIGHVGIPSDLAKAAREINEKQCTQAALILINHDIPEDTEVYKGREKAKKASKKDKKSVSMAMNAGVVFSVGSQVYNNFERKYKTLGNKKPRAHHIFLPRPSSRCVRTHLEVKPVGSQKVVVSIGSIVKREKQKNGSTIVVNLEKLKGYDIATQAIGIVAEKIPNVRYYVREIGFDDWEITQRILEHNLPSGKLRPTLLPCGTHSDIQEDFMTSHLFIMPSRCESFGLGGLNAIAAGLPVLISNQSGLADLIMDLIKNGKCNPDRRHRIVETSMRESDLEEDAKRWADQILETLNHIESEFANAAEFKRELIESKYWEESHHVFLEACGITV